MKPVFHSLHSFPQFSTVREVNCEHCSHHTTTVVAVGCGECVVETVASKIRHLHTHSHSTVGGSNP